MYNVVYPVYINVFRVCVVLHLTLNSKHKDFVLQLL